MKPKVNDIVMVTFLDHCLGNVDDNDPLTFEAYGRLVKITPAHYVLAHWVEPMRGGVRKIDSNTELTTVVRSAIKKVRVFR